MNPSPHKIVIIMGVSGSGKTTLGTALVEATGGQFFDGDDYHPEANIDKMSKGIALDDADRLPWLHNLAKLIVDASHSSQPTYIACSALKQSYRDVLESSGVPLAWICLNASPQLLQDRIKQRYHKEGHFMPPELLHSQLDTLELPEKALCIDVSRPVEDLVLEVLTTGS